MFIFPFNPSHSYTNTGGAFVMFPQTKKTSSSLTGSLVFIDESAKLFATCIMLPASALVKTCGPPPFRFCRTCIPIPYVSLCHQVSEMTLHVKPKGKKVQNKTSVCQCYNFIPPSIFRRWMQLLKNLTMNLKYSKKTKNSRTEEICLVKTFPSFIFDMEQLMQCPCNTGLFFQWGKKTQTENNQIWKQK